MNAHPAAFVKGTQLESHTNQSSVPECVLNTLNAVRWYQLSCGVKKKKKKQPSSVEILLRAEETSEGEGWGDYRAKEGQEQWRKMGKEEKHRREERCVSKTWWEYDLQNEL